MRGSKAKKLRKELGEKHPGRVQEARFMPDIEAEARRHPVMLPRKWRRKMGLVDRKKR